jgi:integrase
MNDFIELKNAAGINVLRTKWILLEIDKFYLSLGIKDAIVTSSLVTKWRKTRINDSNSTIYNKYSVWNQLTRFMCRQGHECYIPPLPQYSSSKKGFTPYIFTHEQIKAIMDKADGLRLYDRHMTCALMFIPAIIRLLYSAGPRVSEVLSIKNEDVNFSESYIIIHKTRMDVRDSCLWMYQWHPFLNSICLTVTGCQ